jgi:SP family facilitated glucose transporter-like MFS transporter 8
MALNQFCGVFAMLNFTATIFKESGSNLSPNISSIIVGGIQIIGSMLPTLLVDRLGRKMMMGISAFGTSIGLSIYGVYTLLKAEGINVEAFNWIPLVVFSFVIFIANLGVLTLPFMIVSEISHPKVNSRDDL